MRTGWRGARDVSAWRKPKAPMIASRDAKSISAVNDSAVSATNEKPIDVRTCNMKTLPKRFYPFHIGQERIAV